MKKIFLLIFCVFLCSGCSKKIPENHKVYFKGDFLYFEYTVSGYIKKVPVKDSKNYKIYKGDVNKDSFSDVILLSEDKLLIYDFSSVPRELRLDTKEKFSVYPSGETNVCVILENGKSFVVHTSKNKDLKFSKPYGYKFSDIDNGNDTEIIYKTDILSGGEKIIEMTISEKYMHGKWYVINVTYKKKGM